MVDHRRAVLLDNLPGQLRVADVEVGLVDDDDLLDLRGRRLGSSVGARATVAKSNKVTITSCLTIE